MLLFAGGSEDSQLAYLIARARDRKLAISSVLHEPSANLPIVWDVDANTLRVGEAEMRATSAFVRQDVFRYLRTRSPTDQADARNWKVMIDGWLWSNPQIRIFNRDFAMKDAVNKPFALGLARECGLPIPRTTVHASRDVAETALRSGPVVYKPVAGGDMCRELEQEALDRVRTPHLPRPYIFQERLVPPEIRIFRVGDRFFAFEIEADALDYRTVGGDARITPVPVPMHLIGPLRKLTGRLGLTYAAADFKASGVSDTLVFLEVNSNPMFVAFDRAADGALADAMLDWLTVSERSVTRRQSAQGKTS